MKRNKIGIVIIIIGIVIISYPIISNIIAAYTRSTVISNYKEQIKQMEEEEIQRQKEKAREYNESLTETDGIDIQINNIGGTSNEQNTSEGVSYLNVLDVGEVLGYISIPKIEIYLPIYHGVSEDVLQSGVGHVENSSFPIGEVGTHAVLAGHTGIVRTKIFDDIDKLELGDKFYINILDEKYAYKVDQIKIVDPEDNQYVGIEEGKEYVTLLTCTPYGINSHRLLVRGSRTELGPEEEKESEEFEKQKTNIDIQIYQFKNVIIIILVVIVLILIHLLIISIKKDIRHKKEDN